MADLWRLPPNELSLGRQDVHVWRIQLRDERVRGVLSGQLLSEAERGAAERFRDHSARRRYVVSHSALRAILGAYARARPADLRFGVTRLGKPYLLWPRPAMDLSFNLSHSGDLALLAVSRRRAVGVDVEAIRPIEDTDRLAQLVLSPFELAAFSLVPAERRLVRFLEYWTAKEAYLKGCGDGIAERVRSFDVCLRDGRPVRLLRVHDRVGDEDRWSLAELPVGDDYLAALAVESGGEWVMSTWEWWGCQRTLAGDDLA